MVATKGYDAGQCLFVFRWAHLFCICGGLAHEETVVAFFDLLDCVGIVVAVNMSVLGPSSAVL